MSNTDDNVHNVRATRRNGCLRQIKLDIPRKITVQIDFDLSNRNVVITIGDRTYIVVPQPPPEPILFQCDDGQALPAVLLKHGESTRTDDLTTSVVLDGDDKFKIGHDTLQTENDKVLYRGKWYKPGDEIVVNGRTAKIQESKALTSK